MTFSRGRKQNVAKIFVKIEKEHSRHISHGEGGGWMMVFYETISSGRDDKKTAATICSPRWLLRYQNSTC